MTVEEVFQVNRLKHVISLSILVLIAGALAQGMDHGQMESPADSLAELHGEEFDIAFMSMMIEHHRGAVEKSAWILEQSGQQLREAAEAIIDSQEEEIDTMRAWLQQWYGQDADPAMVEEMAAENRMMMDHMMAAEDPERAFLEMMIMHHDGAIDMAQLALTRSAQEELRELARDIIFEQAEEIFVFEGWLREWYGAGSIGLQLRGDDAVPA